MAGWLQGTLGSDPDAGGGKVTQTSDQTRLDQFYTDLEAYDLKPLWPIAQELRPLEPRPRTVP